MFGMCNKEHKPCLLIVSKKYALSDVVGEPPSSLIINLEQAPNFFLVWNIHFTFLVDYTFL